MEQLDRRTKLLIAGGLCLLLVIGIIVLAVSCNANRQKEPEPTAVIEVTPTITPTPTATPKPAPTATPTEITAPALPTVTPTAALTPTVTPKPTAGAPTLPSGSTGGTNTKPAATVKPQSTALAFDFGLPSAANVGAQVVVNPSSQNVSSVSWSLNKSGFLGIQTGGAYQGTLNSNGGTISFSEPGQYTLTATAQSSAGKAVTVSQQIEILEVGKFAFGLPKTAYTDTVVDVEVLDGVTADWIRRALWLPSSCPPVKMGWRDTEGNIINSLRSRP